MRLEGRQRWCEGCRQVVHDLSMYDEAEVRKLLRESMGRVCVAYRFDDRGTVQFRRTMRARVGVALASVALAGCVGKPKAELQAPPDPEVYAFEQPPLEEAIREFGRARTAMGVVGRHVGLTPDAIDHRVGLERQAITKLVEPK